MENAANTLHRLINQDPKDMVCSLIGLSDDTITTTLSLALMYTIQAGIEAELAITAERN